MAVAYKPESYNSVSAYLIVPDALKSIAFMKAGLGAQELRVIRNPDDAVVHAEVRIDDTVVMMGQMPGGPPAHIHVYVPDADAAIARALEAGATLVKPATEEGDGDRRGGVKDPDGTTWWLSTQLG
ncbi:MAG: VOC family protein [Pseudomonadota bacterium]